MKSPSAYRHRLTGDSGGVADLSCPNLDRPLLGKPQEIVDRFDPVHIQKDVNFIFGNRGRLTTRQCNRLLHRLSLGLL